MTKLLTITLALFALTACNPLTPVAHLDRAESPVETPVDPPEPQPAPVDVTSAEMQACLARGHSVEECANPPAPEPNVTIPPDADSAEGGNIGPSEPGVPYNGD